jgi:hypothetical protein
MECMNSINESFSPYAIWQLMEYMNFTIGNIRAPHLQGGWGGGGDMPCSSTIIGAWSLHCIKKGGVNTTAYLLLLGHGHSRAKVTVALGVIGAWSLH